MKRTISFMVGKGSQRHNNRDFVAENVDAERTPNNITYCNENIKDVYRIKNSKMEVELKKFNKIKKHFGAETIKRWLDEIKKSKKKIRTEEER
ncbi:MAG: hypothetical protein IJQ50_03890 [Clostridia bacterium]|nr:hypothetical protein [Clostridia bacterium]